MSIADQVNEVFRVAVKPSDVIVIRSKHALTPDIEKRIVDYAKTVWPDNQIVVLHPDFEIEVYEVVAEPATEDAGKLTKGEGSSDSGS